MVCGTFANILIYTNIQRQCINLFEDNNLIHLLLFSVSILTAPDGMIASPGYPSSYANDIETGWLIQVPLGQFIEINFLNIDIASCRDCR